MVIKELLLRNTEAMIDTKEKRIMNNGKILVMDDELSMRYTLSKLLNCLNYEVEVADDGAKAIELYKRAIKSNEPFNAVITDLKVVGGMGGEASIKKLLEINREAKIILCSGSMSDPVFIDFRMYGISAVLRKPFKNDDLEKVLRKVISNK